MAIGLSSIHNKKYIYSWEIGEAWLGEADQTPTYRCIDKLNGLGYIWPWDAVRLITARRRST